MARLPDQIGKYDVVERIGKGGMGMVYKARHPTLDRYVILKKLTISGDASMRERFRREAEIMIDFRTDYVVDVYDHFKQGSNDYIVLEYVEGVALNDLLENERYLDNDLALLVARDCFRGLDYVHGKGVVHRDVKPGNVLISRTGEVKLLDFGIASRVAAFEDELTREGMTLGTVAYIAPEQIERSRDVDRRADVYSAGAMLYEMVTGRKAFSGAFNPETVNRIQRGKYRRPRRVNPRVSPLASRIITRCMRRKPRRRYQSAGEVARLLDAYFRRRGEADLRARLAELAGGEQAATPERRPRRRRRRWVIAAALVVVVLAAGVAGWATGAIQRLVLARTHALAQIEVRLRKTDRTVGEHLVRTELTRIADGEATPVPVTLPLLHAVPGLETPDFVVLRSRLLTLPVGRYEARIRVEDSATREARSLVPAALEPSPQLFRARWDPVADDELRLEVIVVDAESGEPMPEATLELERDGRWVDLVRRGEAWGVKSAVPAPPDDGEALSGPLAGRARLADRVPLVRPVRFVPGQALTVRVSHPDYLETTTTLDTQRLAEAATLRVALVPRPATLLINSRIDGAELFVDGSDRLRAAGPEPALVDAPELFEGVTEIRLVPGAYRIETRSGDAADAVDVRLAPGSQTVLRLVERDEGIDLMIVEEP